MKKIVGIIICALMAFCFVGCGEEVHVDVQSIGDTIRIAEWTDGYVNCVCSVDNSFQINDVKDGLCILEFVNQGIVLQINL